MEHLIPKTTVPQVFHNLLPRKGIAGIIDRAPLDEAVCLVAPYGFGKTLSVISWLRERGLSAVWLSLDETDNSEAVFLAHLSAAAARLTGWQGGGADILKDSLFTEDPQGFFWDKISNAEKCLENRTLVIDNFQFVKDPELQRLVKNITAALIGCWRVVIIGRAEMPPVFNDLILKRHICLITPDELNFGVCEIEEFFAINGRAVSNEEAVRIKNDTDGWPASLNAVLITSKGGAINYGEAAREYVTGFFETEIWHHLDSGTRDFLLKTSILDELTPNLCNAVTDIGAALPVLRRLFVNGLFISRQDKKDSYCCHRAFKDFLRGKFSRSDIDEKELYKKLAWKLFESGEAEQSFPYFFKAGDLYGLSSVLRVLNPANMGVERYLEMAGCITELNVADLKAYPVLVARMALFSYLTGDSEKLHRLYNIFVEWIEPGSLPITAEEYAEYVWEAGWLCYINPAVPVLNNKQHEEWCNYKEFVPHLKTLHFARAAIFRFPSILRGTRDYCPSLSTLEAFMKHNKESGFSIIREETSLLEMDLMMAEYDYERENFSKAEELLRTATVNAERLQMPDYYLVCSALLAKLIRAKHNPREISTLEARAESMITHSGMLFLLPNFHAFQLRNRLAAGQTGFTEQFWEENKNYAEKPYFYLFYRHVTLARALLSSERHSEAALLLGNLEQLCIKYGRTMDTIEIKILRSIADFTLGLTDSAGRFVCEAVDEARMYGFIRIFSDEAGSILPVLESVYGKTRDAYAKKLIISCKKTLARSGIKMPRKNAALSELTKTELKILKTLDADMSYEEIAQDNNIKVSTVKSHIHSIYSKLGVDNRTSAVMEARSLGIIAQ